MAAAKSPSLPASTSANADPPKPAPINRAPRKAGADRKVRLNPALLWPRAERLTDGTDVSGAVGVLAARLPARGGRALDGHEAVDRAGKDDAARIVDVLADEVDAAGGASAPPGIKHCADAGPFPRRARRRCRRR